MSESPRAVPTITLVGFNHRSTPIGLREQLAYAEKEIPMALDELSMFVDEAYLLSTCNRTELYVVADPPVHVDSLLRYLAESRDVLFDALGGHYYAPRDDQAVQHLLEVASGLDSMVLGEAQILGQVADAFESASATGTIGRVLGRVLPLALEVGKRARTESRIGQGLVSTSSVAVDLARGALGDLRRRSVLVIGAGDAAHATVRSLRDAGVGRIVVANRSMERGEAIAASVGGVAIPQAEIVVALESVDMVISSTAATEHVVSATDVASAMARRDGRRLLCIDIAVPRDLDPTLAEIPGVLLYNVDDLEATCAANLEDRHREIAVVKTLVDEGVEDYRTWRTIQPVIPTIGALYRRAEAIRRAEVDRTLRRLGKLSESDLHLIDAMTSSIVRRILHDPVTTLRARGGDPDVQTLARSVQELFRLPSEDAEFAGPSS